jgi:hypothetical protein
VAPPAEVPVARYQAEPFAVITEIVRRIEPTLSAEAVAEAIGAACTFRPQQRMLAKALMHDPGLLTSGRPEGPRKVELLIRALRERGAVRLQLPRCAHCHKPNPLTGVDGAARICGYCSVLRAKAPCSACGTIAPVCTRDRAGRPRCQQCPPQETTDPVGAICDQVAAVDPHLPRDLVAELVREIAPRPARQRELSWALEANPGLLTGAGAHGPPKLLDLIDVLTRRGAHGLVSPPCPRCRQQRPLTRTLDGQRCCRPCREQARPAETCIRCGLAKPVASRDESGSALCHPCRRADPINREPCTGCGRLATIARKSGESRLCSTCYKPPLALCARCGRTAHCYYSTSDAPCCENCARRARTPEPCARCGKSRPACARLPDGTALCNPCAMKPQPCSTCGKSKTVAGRGEQGEALCRVCYPKHPASYRACVRCDTLGRLYHHGLCNACAAERRLRGLLGGDSGSIRPELEPVFQALIRSDPLAVMLWLRKGAPRSVLTALADGTEPVTHRQLDALLPARSVQHIRAALVTGGALPPRDEQLATLERWLPTALDQIQNPDERATLRAWVTWHHLRRLRTGKDAKPLSYTRMNKIRGETNAAIRLLTWLADRGTSLAACTQYDIDIWTTDGPARRYEARWFLLWAVAHHHARHVEIPNPVRETPTTFIEHDQRWDLVRRLLHDDDLDTATRVGGLLVLLFAQPLNTIVRISLDQITHTDGQVTILLGTTPVELPPPLDTLVLDMLRQRHGTAVIGRTDDHPWLFPGGKAGLPLSLQSLMRRLKALGIKARPARNTTLMELAAELPDIVLSRLLGIHHSTAARWLRVAGRPDAEYAAELTHRQAFNTFQ